MSLHFERLEADFQRSISEAIRDMKDPRLSVMTSVVRTELSKDLKHAKVFVSVFDDDPKRRAEVISVLGNASSMLGHVINAKMKMRRIPALHFALDDGIAYSAHINELLQQINVRKDDGGDEAMRKDDGADVTMRNDDGEDETN